MMIKLKVFVLFVLLGIAVSHSQTWVSGYNGSANGDDQVTAVCSDQNENVYVTGFSAGLNTGSDIITIKYDKDGDTLWTRRYNGAADEEDKAFGIAIDESGFIYVAGFVTTSASNHEDMILIKYSPSGSQVWAKTYNGGSGTSDRAFGLAIDNSGADNSSIKIYITGYSSSGSDYDFKTLKYLNDGTLDWAKYYDGGSNTNDQSWGIAVDETGFVVVTGFSQTSSNSPLDYYTIKYSSDGVVSWARRFNGPGNGEDRSFGLVIDSEKNYTVTGYSAGSSNGNPLTYDIATIQYDKEGAVRWTKIYNSPDDMEDRAFGITIDALNNIYVAGTTQRNATSKDFITIKYSAAGTQSWVTTYNAGSNRSDIAYDIALSPNGSSVYVIGSSVGESSENPVMVKYNSNGELQQSILYSTAGRVTCLEVSNINNLFTAGYSVVNSGDNAINNDFITFEFERGLITLIGITGNNSQVPSKYILGQNYPNPFNPSTTVKIAMPNSGFARLVVLDVTGKQISSLVNQNLAAGTYEVSFDAGSLASGIYFYKLVVSEGLATSFSDTKKMVLIK